MTFQGLYVLINGTARCHWTEEKTRTVGTGDHQRNESYTEHYDGKEIFLNSKSYLLGEDGLKLTEIAAGTYKYNFVVELPQLLPESFKGKWGSIEYKAEVVLDVPWRFDREIVSPFSVLRRDNPNDFPELKIPLRQDEAHDFCCFFCSTGKCLITVTIPCEGFSAGKSIPIKVEYANESNIDIERTLVKLLRTVQYICSTPYTETKKEYDKMVEISVEGCKTLQNKSLNFSLEIPENVFGSNVRYCKIIQVSYSLRVESVVSGCHINPAFAFPITIFADGVGRESDTEEVDGKSDDSWSAGEENEPRKNQASIPSLPQFFAPSTLR